MQSITRAVVVLIAVVLPFAAQAGGGKSLGKASGIVPAHLEEIPGSDLKKVVFTAKAAERTGVETDSVREAQVPPKRKASGRVTRKVVPYSALIYTPDGRTWVYVSPTKLNYIRQEVVVAYIDGDRAVLNEGPEAGLQVVTIGVAEVYGAEFGVGH